MLFHADNNQATAFLNNTKLPHYVDFQSELELVLQLRHNAQANQMATDLWRWSK